MRTTLLVTSMLFAAPLSATPLHDPSHPAWLIGTFVDGKGPPVQAGTEACKQTQMWTHSINGYQGWMLGSGTWRYANGRLYSSDYILDDAARGGSVKEGRDLIGMPVRPTTAGYKTYSDGRWHDVRRCIVGGWGGDGYVTKKLRRDVDRTKSSLNTRHAR